MHVRVYDEIWDLREFRGLGFRVSGEARQDTA